ncbi:MAG: DUF4157 domain-containing protein [Azonexus sp.]|jgi:hypothetical protein|nr:DUF4157 domain-containing protein [Azonexus sp.]
MEAAARLVNRPAPPVPAAAAKVAESVAVRAQCQSLRVSSPGDAAEVEAQRVASVVVNMPAPAGVAARVSLPVGTLSRALRPGVSMPSRAAPSPALPGIPSGGQALGAEVRRFMEPRFGASFAGVRIHTDDTAARLAGQMQARAFAVGNQIFFGAGQFRPESREGRELIAHELTHTLQQGAGRQPQSIQRSFLGDLAKDIGLPDPRDYIAGKASSIRGFDFMTVVIGKNPITDAKVDDSAANVLRQATKVMPGGGDIAKALDNHGIFDKAGKWISGKFTALKNLGSEIKTSVSDFITGIKLSDMKNPGGVWDRGKALLVGIVTGILDFVGGIVGDILDFIKDAILKPIGAYARTTSGYPLLCTVLGKDPITGDKAPQDAEAYLGGFLVFVGENEIWANMKKANAVQKAFAWFKGAAKALVDFVSEIPTLFIAALKSLTISDILLIPKAFIKLGKVFAGFAGRFISWAAKAAFDLLEIILDSVKPGLMGYIKRTGGALKGILRNPMPFAGNLIAAGKLGFTQFAGNFLTHLKAGLIEWLTGALPGVYIPAGFDLKEIVKFVLSVLGISWANVRGKLVKVVGEPAVKAMETGFDIVVTLVRDGPAAAWDKIKEQLGNLKDMVIGGITSFVVDMVVKKAVPKIIAMFIPGAGFISAAISIYESVMVFVQKLSKIAAVVGAFVNSIVQIAAGNIGGAAKRVESVLAGLLSLAISFLAGFAGLGKVADKVMGVINKVRAPIDKALDALIGWIVTMAKKLFAKAFGKDKNDERTPEQKQADLNKALAEAQALQSAPKATSATVRKGLGAIKSKYRMQALDLVVDKQDDGEETVHVHGEINPKGDTAAAKFAKDGTVGPLGISRKMLTWEQATLDHFVKDKIWKEFKAIPGDYLSAEIDIRHKVSISDTIKNTDDSLAPKKPPEAAQMLTEKQYPPVAKGPGKYDKPGIVDAARKLLQAANNDIKNLFLGAASVNRGIGKRYDPGDGGNARAAKHDKQKGDFIEKWGFKDEEFKITIERKSEKRGTEDEVEVWK